MSDREWEEERRGVEEAWRREAEEDERRRKEEAEAEWQISQEYAAERAWRLGKPW